MKITKQDLVNAKAAFAAANLMVAEKRLPQATASQIGRSKVGRVAYVLGLLASGQPIPDVVRVDGLDSGENLDDVCQTAKRVMQRTGIAFPFLAPKAGKRGRRPNESGFATLERALEQAADVAVDAAVDADADAAVDADADAAVDADADADADNA